MYRAINKDYYRVTVYLYYLDTYLIYIATIYLEL